MNQLREKPEGYFLLMQPQQQGGVQVDLAAAWLSIRHGWRVILATVVVLVALAALHAFVLATKIYSSTALISVKTREVGAAAGAATQFQGLASLAGINLSGGDSKREEFIAILSSRTVVRTLIEKDNLLPVLFSSKYDSKTKAWKDTPPTMGNAVDYFTRSVRTITEDKKTGLIKVEVRWRDRQLAAQWASQLVAIANRTVRDAAIKQAQKNLQYLKREMAGETFETVRESLLRLTQINMNQAMLAQVQSDYAYVIIDAPEVAEKDKFVRPQRAVEIAVAILLGILLSVTYLLVHNWRSIRQRRFEIQDGFVQG